jgi:hypothetical protein
MKQSKYLSRNKEKRV